MTMYAGFDVSDKMTHSCRVCGKVVQATAPDVLP